MGRSKKNKKSNRQRLSPFTPIFNEILDSQAFRELPGNAAKGFLYFKWIHGMLGYKLGDDFNGIFDLTYSEAEKFGFARKTFSRIITELCDKGFINIVVQGGKRGCGMSNSKYKLSDRWRDYGTSTFIQKPRYRSEP